MVVGIFLFIFPEGWPSKQESKELILPTPNRWLILYILCLGVVMIVLDGTVVNVALPSIKADLGFSNTTLVWVVNGYLLTFGGFLLLGGRLGDFYGHRRLFLAGLAVFTLASLACGLATSQWMLVAARCPLDRHTRCRRRSHPYGARATGGNRLQHVPRPEQRK